MADVLVIGECQCNTSDITYQYCPLSCVDRFNKRQHKKALGDKLSNVASFDYEVFYIVLISLQRINQLGILTEFKLLNFNFFKFHLK